MKPLFTVFFLFCDCLSDVFSPKCVSVSSNLFTSYAAAKIDSQLQEGQRHNNNINKDLNADKIRSRLQHMQLELSSALHSLRSTTLTLNPEVSNNKLLSS
ncbi:hypothetical protein R6Q57_021670 [Mikania cordata]